MIKSKLTDPGKEVSIFVALRISLYYKQQQVAKAGQTLRIFCKNNQFSSSSVFELTNITGTDHLWNDNTDFLWDSDFVSKIDRSLFAWLVPWELKAKV